MTAKERQEKEKPTMMVSLGEVRALVFDFDGVFTDNTVYVFEDGREAVVCSRSDGLGLDKLRNARLPMLVLSTEKNQVVAARCKKVKLPYLQGVGDKLPALKKWLSERHVALDKTAYLGNDVNDLACMQAVGWPVAVADAYPEVKQVARLVLKKPGGRGAIRELADLLVPSL